MLTPIEILEIRLLNNTVWQSPAVVVVGRPALLNGHQCCTQEWPGSIQPFNVVMKSSQVGKPLIGKYKE